MEQKEPAKDIALGSFRIRIHDLKTDQILPPVHPEDMPSLLVNDPAAAAKLLRAEFAKLQQEGLTDSE